MQLFLYRLALTINTYLVKTVTENATFWKRFSVFDFAWAKNVSLLLYLDLRHKS